MFPEVKEKVALLTPQSKTAPPPPLSPPYPRSCSHNTHRVGRGNRIGEFLPGHINLRTLRPFCLPYFAAIYLVPHLSLPLPYPPPPTGQTRRCPCGIVVLHLMVGKSFLFIFVYCL